MMILFLFVLHRDTIQIAEWISVCTMLNTNNIDTHATSSKYLITSTSIKICRPLYYIFCRKETIYYRFLTLLCNNPRTRRIITNNCYPHIISIVTNVNEEELLNKIMLSGHGVPVCWVCLWRPVPAPPSPHQRIGNIQRRFNCEHQSTIRETRNVRAITN